MKLVKKRNAEFMCWMPRILAILFLMFLAMFSLDVFEEGYNFWGIIVALLMHNIPVFVLAIALWISWKYEIVGGVTFILAAIFYELLTGKSTMAYSLIISGPALIIGILFLVNWCKKKGRLR